MRKFLFFALLMVVSCMGKYGKGGDNAAQFVREQVVGNPDNIASIETILEDSLLGDAFLSFYQTPADERLKILQDVLDSWLFGIVVNDSLKTLKKYDGVWRKVYTVRVTMKSGVKNDVRVLMDGDGATPRMLERDFDALLHDYYHDEFQEQLHLVDEVEEVVVD